MRSGTSEELTVKYIADIYTDFEEKFGIPRQSGLVEGLTGRIVFRPEFRIPEAIRGLEGFSHLWVLFDFSQAHRDNWSPTVRPPRLGGNRRVGVFASRSPFRPNPIGLSCVKLERIERGTAEGDVLVVSGVDMLSGTPVLDIKPYLPYADCRPEARGGYAEEVFGQRCRVNVEDGALDNVPEDKREALLECLAQDPRPHYQDDEARVYGLRFAGTEVRFRADEGGITVISAEPCRDAAGNDTDGNR